MPSGLISTFVRHPVAPNLAMAVMILAGLWALSQLTRQVLPSFELNLVQVEVQWPGAAAEDVQAAVTQPLEDNLRALDGVRDVSSTSREGSATVTLEYDESADIARSLDQVKDAVTQIRNLPESAETPAVSLVPREERVARLVMTGPDLATLRPLVRQFERELRALGLARITAEGLPLEEIAIKLPGARLEELNLSLRDIAGRVRDASRDVPAGSVGRAEVARQLRSQDQARSVTDFRQLPLLADEAGRLVTVGDVAEVERQARVDQELLYFDGRPAVELQVFRAEQDDAIDIAQRMLGWIARTEAKLPSGVAFTVYDEPWREVSDRIDLMLDNALSGMLLVVGVLYVFLNGRVAFWVAVGIPVSIMGGLMALELLGGTLNMISLFAMVMALGIVVDDAIVVGEETVRRYQAGARPVEAAEEAAHRMWAPVLAASLTTAAAFLPLMTIGGAGGSILFAIPLIMICVVLASLLECFLVLPGHLRHSLAAFERSPPSRFRLWFDSRFEAWRCGTFRRWVASAVESRGATVSWALASLIVAVGLMLGGRLEFTLFPQPDAPMVQALVRFGAGTPGDRAEAFVGEVARALEATEQQAGEKLVALQMVKLGLDPRGTRGPHVAHVVVELLPQEQRSWTNSEIVRAWRRNVLVPPGVESFVLLNTSQGPHGNDIDLDLVGTDPQALKVAAIDVAEALGSIAGVSGIRDDTAYGKEQLIFALSPTGEALGLTSDALGRQLRAAFEGEVVQIFQDRGEEVEVRVVLADRERDTISALETVPVVLPSGNTVPLSDVARLSYQRGFESLKRSGGDLAINLTADVDEQLNNNNAVRAQLRDGILREVAAREGVDGYRFGGDAEDQGQTLGDVGTALPLAFLMIYIILAWVFASYAWPFAILSVVPFGIAGALFGHWLMGFDFTLMSIFGLFGLTGIVINDSIILVSVYRELRENGMDAAGAAIEAAVRRARAVILTSITTVFGVAPILFESAVQSQFLKPLIISLAFGVASATGIVLLVLPAVLTAIDLRSQQLRRLLGRWLPAREPARDPAL